MKNLTLARFWIWAVLLTLVAALLLSVCMPQIQSWQSRVVDKLLNEAQASSSPTTRYSYLQQASIVGYRDPAAIEAMAQFWLGRGEVQRAIGIYETRISEPNYVALGNLALQAQDYSKAQKFFVKAEKEDSTGAATGLAATYYNQDKPNEACEQSVKAYKLDLQDTTAKNAVVLCVLMNPSFTEAQGLTTQPSLNDREVAYLLLDSKIYKLAEAKLTSLVTKSKDDYLTLARLVAARGEIDQALSFTFAANNLDKSDIPTNQLLVQLYTLKGNIGEAQVYQNRLVQLEFSKY